MDGFQVVPKKAGKMKGSGLVITGLVFGFFQALLTIPRGGGYAYLVLVGGLLGGIGMIIVGFKNGFSNKTKKGAMIGAVIFFVALALASYQVILFNGLVDDMEKLDQNSQNINSDNWKEKKSAMVDDMNGILDILVQGVILLAASTGLLAVGGTIHILLSDHKKKRLMFIPIVLFTIAMVAVPMLTITGVSSMRDALDDMEAAESQRDVEKVADDVNAIEPMDMLRGSQVGGAINLVNLILVMVLFKKLKPLPEFSGEGSFAAPLGYPQMNPYSQMGQNPLMDSNAQMNPTPQYNTPLQPAPQQYYCEYCGQPLQYIAQYQRNYCQNCQQFR